MVGRDSLSDSDEVMSEPRTKLSLPCPTETPSLLAFPIFSYLILRSTTLCCHFILCLYCLVECATLEWDREKCKEEKSITSLLRVGGPLWCNSSSSLFKLKWPYLQSSITTIWRGGRGVAGVKSERKCMYLEIMPWACDWMTGLVQSSTFNYSTWTRTIRTGNHNFLSAVIINRSEKKRQVSFTYSCYPPKSSWGYFQLQVK